MVDFDYDGVMDILLATNDGELLIIKDTVRPTCPDPNRELTEILMALQTSRDLKSLGCPCLWLS